MSCKNIAVFRIGRGIVVVNSNPTNCATTVCLNHTNLGPIVIANTLSPNKRLIGAARIRGFPKFPRNVLNPSLVSHVGRRTGHFNAACVTSSISSVRTYRDSSIGPACHMALSSSSRLRTSTLVVTAKSSFHGLKIPNRRRVSKRNISCYTAYSNFFFGGGPVIIMNNNSSTFRRTLFLAQFNSSIALVRQHSDFHTSRVVISQTGTGPAVALLAGAIIASVANASSPARGANTPVTVPNLAVGQPTITPTDIDDVTMHGIIAKRRDALSAGTIFITVNRAPTASFTTNIISHSSSKCIIIRNTDAIADTPNVFTTNSYISHACHRTVDTTNVNYHTTLSTRTCLAS